MFQMYAVASATAIGDSLSADCVLRTSNMRPVQAWAVAMVVIPPVVVVLWVVIFKSMSVFSKTKTDYLKVHFPVAVIVTLLFAHPVVTKSAVKLVACRTVAGKNYLDADFNVSCDSEEYLLWVSAVAVPLFVLYTFGIPLTYALAMYRHVRKGTLQTRRDIYGFFFSGNFLLFCTFLFGCGCTMYTVLIHFFPQAFVRRFGGSNCGTRFASPCLRFVL